MAEAVTTQATTEATPKPADPKAKNDAPKDAGKDATLDVNTVATAPGDVANPPADQADVAKDLGDTGQAPKPGELPASAVGKHAAEEGDVPQDELLHDDMAFSAQNPIKRAVVGYLDEAADHIKALFEHGEAETDRDTDAK